MAEARLRQDILFPAGASLGISVDEALKVRRVNDPDSRAIKAARYGVVHWTVVEVDGAAVSTKRIPTRLMILREGPVPRTPSSGRAPSTAATSTRASRNW